MAMIDTSRVAPFGAITTYRVTNALSTAGRAVIGIVSERLTAKRTADELGRLGPQLLSDIGMSEADVVSYRARAGLL